MRRRYKFKKIKKKKKFFLFKKSFWLVLFFLSLLGTGFYYFFYSGLLEIEKIEIKGNKEIPVESIKNIIVREIEEKIFSFFPRNIILINFGKISQKLLFEFPRIKEIVLKRKFPNSIEAAIIERSPVAFWCKEEDCFSLDEEGIIFAKGEKKEGLVIKSNKKVNLFEKIIEKEKLEDILKIYKELKNSFTIEEIFISEKEKITVKGREGWEIYFNQDNVDEQIINLKAVIQEKIPLEKINELQYIDLRFGNKIYFKYK